LTAGGAFFAGSIVQAVTFNFSGALVSSRNLPFP
jgi:hypothetical protein